MRDVKSKSYFEHMKGRGTRTFGYDDMKKVTPSAMSAKTHFVVVDAVGDEDLLNAFNPDKLKEKAQVMMVKNPEITQTQALELVKESLSRTASSVFNGLKENIFTHR